MTESILYREIDYRDEADNAIRFANDFGIGLGGVEIESTAKGVDGNVLPSAAEWLRTPYTYGDLSSEKFLVMEYVPSIKANNNEALDKAGVTLEDREYLAECLAHAYLRQFCAHKFFSTDPHAGMFNLVSHGLLHSHLYRPSLTMHSSFTMKGTWELKFSRMTVRGPHGWYFMTLDRHVLLQMTKLAES